jgi:TetR/AcrR family transcriptional repressor of nem operon
MTDSLSAIPGGSQPGTKGAQGSKRERLIAAAAETIYTAGVEKTTLADIAAAAGRAMLAAIDHAYPGPRERLKALFGALAQQSDLIARYGCPHGSLCQELGKRADGTPAAAELMREPVEWAERQFAATGRPDARDLAVQVIARYQGTALLTSAFRDPGLMEAEARRVAQWIDTLD